MHHLAQSITKVVDPRHSDYARHFAGCLIQTRDGRLLLQRRGKNWDRFPDTLATFGGQIDAGESFVEGMARELAEELGATFGMEAAIYLGSITKIGLDNALIHVFWWHDKANSITGCYEGEPAYFANAAEILSQENITPDVYWIVNECLCRGLIE
jgi:8-oxo-dGTP pyrophosphatase MutT (NUDIX family)